MIECINIKLHMDVLFLYFKKSEKAYENILF